MAKPLITLLTDFGSRDHYVAAMKGVMLGICPDADFVDISHEIEPYSIEQAAWTLLRAWEYFPAGTAHLAVIDPGVGSPRLPLAAAAGGHFFVGPDNGVLSQALDANRSSEVYEIDVAEYSRKPLSHTFHGRDIFAPVAARLAGGQPIAQLGRRVHEYARSGFGKPVQTEPGRWTGRVVHIDRFGNIITNFEGDIYAEINARPFEIIVGSRAITVFHRNYSDAAPGECFVTLGSLNLLEISLPQASAAKALGVRIGIALDFRLY